MVGGARAVRSLRFRTLTVVAVCAASLLAPGCGGSQDTARRAAPAYLFSIEAGSGSLTKRSDNHLTLRLSGARDYLTQFTDRPLRQAFVVANVDFARRFGDYFQGSRPNAVLAYTPRGAQIPRSVVLTIGQPRWNAKRSIWTFAATPIPKQPGRLRGGSAQIKPPPMPKPRSLNQATLVIDDSIDNGEQGG